MGKTEKVLKLTGDDHKHLSLVLRARIGETVAVSTGDGFDYFYTIESISKSETILSFIEKRQNLSEPTIQLTLFTAVLKGDKNETVVRMCTELGVTRICPMVTEYTVALGESYKTERMRKIALEASKQSGRGRVPEIFEPMTFNDAVKVFADFDCVVFPYEHAEEIGIKDFLGEKLFKAKKPVVNIAVLVGSEGGFSKKEAEKLIEQGITPITLGKRILRADTACITVCAMILYAAEEMA